MNIPFPEIQEQANKLFENGNQRVTVTFSDGETSKLRLFKHSTEGLCYISSLLLFLYKNPLDSFH